MRLNITLVVICVAMLLCISSASAGNSTQYDDNITVLLHGNYNPPASNYTFVDSSSNARPVTSFGNATTDTNRYLYGNASISLDGQHGANFSYLQMPDSPDWPNGDGNWTFQAWVRANTPDTWGDLYGQFNAAANDGGIYCQITNTNNVRFKVYTTSGITSSLDSAGTIPTTEWNYIFVNKSGTKISMYINGTSQGTRTLSGPINDSISHFSVGALGDYLPDSFNGTIDEFAMWNRSIPVDDLYPQYVEIGTLNGTNDFTADRVGGQFPLSVHFSDASVGVNPNQWNWTFGDGYASTLQNPLHIYSTPGVYNVTLTVTNTTTPRSLTKTKQDFIHVWRDDNLGKIWTQLNSSAFSPFSRYGAVLLYKNGTLYEIAGRSNGIRINQTWSSSDLGRTWVQLNPSAEFDARDFLNGWVLGDTMYIATDVIFKRINPTPIFH